MGKTLIIKGADFSANRIPSRIYIDITGDKTADYGYVSINSTVGQPLSPNGGHYDAFFVELNVADLATNNFIVEQYRSAGSSLLAVAILDESDNLWKKLTTNGTSEGTYYIPETIITQETLSGYVGTTFTLFIQQNKSTFTAVSRIVKQEL